MPLDERARALLSKDVLPMVAVPRARTHHQRNFRLPTCVRPKKRPPSEPREHQTPLGFGDRTTTWLRQGDDFEVEFGELEYEDEPRRFVLPVLIGSAALALATLIWLIAT